MRKIFVGISAFILFSTAVNAYVIRHSEFWLTGTFIGPLSIDNPKIKYYFEPRARLIDNRFVLNQARVYYGVGYQFTPVVTSFIGGGYVINDNLGGVKLRENRIWEQLGWDIYKSKCFNVAEFSRLEERKNTQLSQWAWRLRQKVVFKIPLPFWQKHSLMSFEEVFLNFNHPSWVSRAFFAENRAFLGIETEITKHTSIDIGYLNQYQVQSPNPNQMNNVLYVTYNMQC